MLLCTEKEAEGLRGKPNTLNLREKWTHSGCIHPGDLSSVCVCSRAGGNRFNLALSPYEPQPLVFFGDGILAGN